MKAATGDAASWERLVDRFSGLVWSIARSTGLSPADAADVSQTTWLRLAEHLHLLETPSKVGAWLATTARRESMRVSKLGSRELLIDPWSEIAPPVADLDLEAAMIDRARDAVIQEAMAMLPERSRQLLIALTADPPLSYEQISQQLDMPIGSIGPTRARCLAQLRSTIATIETGSRRVARASWSDG